MNSEKENLVLIDSNAIIHRAYHALPQNMSTSSGELTNAVYGYTTTLIKILEDLKPKYLAATFDLAGPTFRHEKFDGYKATRVKADQELYDQIPKVRELLQVLEIPVYEKAGFEADDVIGTIIQQCQNAKFLISNFKSNSKSQLANKQKKSQREYSDHNSDLDVYIVTGDKDAFQLVDDNVFVCNLKHGLNNAQIVDRDTIKKDWNLQPEDFIDLKALAGDPSDNIPGVPGIGPKTATELLIKFDTLVKLYELIESRIRNQESGVEKKHDSKFSIHDSTIKTVSSDLNIKPRILSLLIEYKEQAFLSQHLATIRKDVPIDFDLDDCVWGDYDREKLADFFEKMQFRSLLRRFGGNNSAPKQQTKEKTKDDQLSLL